MNKELEKRLIAQFPAFFRDMYGSPQTTCMADGCTCGDGWFQLIEGVCSDIQKELEQTPDPDFKWAQIKEKFGGLRLYCQTTNRNICNIINVAESASYTICEHCGTSENVSTNETGYIQSLCDRCREESYENT